MIKRKNIMPKVGIFILTLLVFQMFMGAVETEAQTAACDSNIYYGMVTVNGKPQDGATVSLSDLTNNPPALTVTTSGGGWYAVDAAYFSIYCPTAGDEMQLTAFYNGNSVKAKGPFSLAATTTAVNLPIATSDTGVPISSITPFGTNTAPIDTVSTNNPASNPSTVPTNTYTTSLPPAQTDQAMLNQTQSSSLPASTPATQSGSSELSQQQQIVNLLTQTVNLMRELIKSKGMTPQA